jgi:hypothetical protein
MRRRNGSPAARLSMLAPEVMVTHRFWVTPEEALTVLAVIV